MPTNPYVRRGTLLGTILGFGEGRRQSEDVSAHNKYLGELTQEKARTRSEIGNILGSQPDIDPAQLDRKLTEMQTRRILPDLPEYKSDLAPILLEKAMKQRPEILKGLEEKIERKGMGRFRTMEDIYSDQVKDDLDFIRNMSPFLEEQEARTLIESRNKPGGILNDPKSYKIIRNAQTRQFDQEMKEFYAKKATTDKKEDKGERMTEGQLEDVTRKSVTEWEPVLDSLTGLNMAGGIEELPSNLQLPPTSPLYVPGRMETLGDWNRVKIDLATVSKNNIKSNVFDARQQGINDSEGVYVGHFENAGLIDLFQTGRVTEGLDQIERLKIKHQGRAQQMKERLMGEAEGRTPRAPTGSQQQSTKTKEAIGKAPEDINMFFEQVMNPEQ